MKKVISSVCVALSIISICTILCFKIFNKLTTAVNSTNEPTTAVNSTIEPTTTENSTDEPTTTEGSITTDIGFSLSHSSKSKLPLVSAYKDSAYKDMEMLHPFNGYHPKILDFGDDGWNGYRYWVSFTPYPYGLDYYENAHVIATNDLINYSDIKHFEKPLKNYKKSVRFNSDSHLVYNDDLDRLELFWRYTDYDENYMALYRETSTDGENWSEAETFYTTYDLKNDDLVSPAIIYENGTYKIWYVKCYDVYYKEYRDGKWSKPVKTKLKYEDNASTWHVDVIKTDKGYELLTCATKDTSDRRHMNLYYTTSPDGMNWDTAKLVLTPSDNKDNWDGGGLYRSSFIYSDGMYYVLYSGRNDKKNIGTGLVFGKDMYHLYGTDLDYIKNGPEASIKFWEFINDFKTSDYVPKNIK